MSLVNCHRNPDARAKAIFLVAITALVGIFLPYLSAILMPRPLVNWIWASAYGLGFWGISQFAEMRPGIAACLLIISSWLAVIRFDRIPETFAFYLPIFQIFLDY